MSTTPDFHQHLTQNFSNYSIIELIHLNNETIKNDSWGNNKAIFRTAIISALSRKGVDLSNIITKEDGFTTVKLVAVKLEKNKLIPLHNE